MESTVRFLNVHHRERWCAVLKILGDQTATSESVVRVSVPSSPGSDKTSPGLGIEGFVFADLSLVGTDANQ